MNINDVTNNNLNLSISRQQRSDRFMIQIVNKEITINGSDFVATFFKDITFSVLYEQIRAQDQFKDLFTKALQ